MIIYAFKAVHELALSLLSELVIFYKPTRSLWSEIDDLIEMPKNKRTKMYGERIFDEAMGISLPANPRNEQSLKLFKKGLKMLLIKVAFVDRS